MQTAGARVLREDDNEDMSREAVLLQWERKIEVAERRPSRYRPEPRDGAESGHDAAVAELRPSEDATHDDPLRSSAAPPSCSPSSRSPSAARSPSPASPTPARRRASRS